MSTTLTWINPNGGTFDTSTNWNPQAQPGTTDLVLFQISTTVAHTYTVTGNGTVNGIEVQGDNVTITGTLTATSATINASLGGPELDVIDGSMTIAAGAALLEQTAGVGNIGVGNSSLQTSAASLVVNGTVIASGVQIGASSAGSLTATVAVSGTAASFQAVSVLINHDGTLDIAAGATVSDVTAIVGSTVGPAYGMVTGPHSTWANTFAGLEIGQSNVAGTVTVTNDATVTSTGATLLINSEGALLLDDTATIIGAYELKGGLIEALAALGQTSLGTITIGNAIELDVGSASTLAATSLTAFDVTGQVTGSGTLVVRGGTVELADAANSFSGGIAVGDEATVLIAASGAQGTGSITFATTSGDTLGNAGTLALLAGVAVTNALVVSSGTATLAIPFGASDALTNSVSGAGALALEGGSFTLSTPSTQAQTGGMIVQSGTLILTNGEQGLGGPLSFGAFGGASIVWDTATAPSAATLTIGGFLGDSIVFPDLTFNGETINSSGTVTLTENGVAVGSLVLNGATGNLRAVQYTSGGQKISALTADSAWAAPVSGTFGTASNWQYNAAPGSTNIAFFSLNSPTPYTVSGGGTVAAMDVQGDQVTLTGSYTVLGQPASQTSFLPLQVGSNGKLTVAAGASVTGPSAASQFNFVGTGTGGGTLDVLGTLSVGDLLADQGGTVIVDGAGAHATATGIFGVGYGTANELAPADLVIEAGATVTGATGYVGFSTTATALVTGAGSTWTSTGPQGLSIGNGVNAVPSALTVENNGTVSSTQPIGLLNASTLAISPTGTLIGTVEALGQNLAASAVLEAVADPGQTGPAVTTVSNAVALSSGALVLAGSAETTLDVTGKVTEVLGSSAVIAVNHVILADAANSFNTVVDIGAPAGDPFAGDAGVLEEAATGALGTGAIGFAAGASTLIYDSGVTPTNTVYAFAAGDVIDLRGLAFVQGATASVSGTTLTVTSGTVSETITVANTLAGTPLLALSDQTGATPGTEVVWLHCFGAGTPIATPDGNRRIESLAAGDAVRCADGSVRPIVWTGGWDTDVATHPWPESVAPVRVRSNAFGPGMPLRDIILSPDHAVPLDGVLVPIRRLINGATIRQERVSRVRYHHIAVDGHAILLADGLPAESLRDVAQCDRLGADLAALPPGRGGGAPCLPLIDDDAIAAALWQRLAARAEALGLAVRYPDSSDDPDLHLMIRGRRVRPVDCRGDRVTFALPPGVERVELCSRAAPATATRPWADDRRRLGVAVRAVRLQGNALVDTLVPDHPAFADGWWPAERATGRFRWTDGRGAVNLPEGTWLASFDLAVRGSYPAGTA